MILLITLAIEGLSCYSGYNPYVMAILGILELFIELSFIFIFTRF